MTELRKALEEVYKKGTRVELIKMDDIQAPPVGTKGTVRGVDDMGSILMNWDNGSTLSVVYGEDVVKIISEPEPKEDILDNFPLLSEKTKNFIRERMKKDGNGKDTFKGFYMNGLENINRYLEHLGVKYLEGSDITGFGCNKKELFSFLWIEGDLFLCVFKDEAGFNKELEELNKWWKSAMG